MRAHFKYSMLFPLFIATPFITAPCIAHNTEIADNLAKDAQSSISHSHESHSHSHSHSGKNTTLLKKEMTNKNLSIEERIQYAAQLQRNHQFAKSRAELEKILQQTPHELNAILLHASVSNVMGDYDTARRSCQKLFRHSDSLTAISCLSSISLMSGRADLGYKLITQLINKNLERSHIESEHLLWALGIAAELAWSTGQVDEAEHFYQLAKADLPRKRHLATSATEHYLMISYGDFLINQHRYQEAIDFFKPFAHAHEIKIRLVQAYKALNIQQWEPLLESLVSHYEHEPLGHPHHREAAMSALLQLSVDSSINYKNRAIQLATQNWQKQKEKIDAKLLLEIAIASKMPDAAQPVMHWISTHNIKDIDLNPLVKKVHSLHQELGSLPILNNKYIKYPLFTFPNKQYKQIAI